MVVTGYCDGGRGNRIEIEGVGLGDCGLDGAMDLLERVTRVDMLELLRR